VWFVETFAAGPEAMARVERLIDELERLAIEALNESPERTGIPRPLVRAIVGGLRQVIQTRLRQRRQAELTELVPDLFAWALSYRTPTEPLSRPRKAPSLPAASPEPDPQRAKILDAVTKLAAEKSYQSMTITEIARRAAISLTTFYAQFESKEAVFLAAIDDGERRLVETSLPAYRRGSDWPHSVKDGLHAFFAFFARNGATARLGGLNLFSGAREALERYERSTTGFEALLQPGYRHFPDTNPVAAEAIRGAVAALLYQQLRVQGPGSLYEVAPTATFIALAPFTGTERATEVANQGWRPEQG
jgi:AcrR family transcriptional regulator